MHAKPVNVRQLGIPVVGENRSDCTSFDFTASMTRNGPEPTGRSQNADGSTAMFLLWLDSSSCSGRRAAASVAAIYIGLFGHAMTVRLHLRRVPGTFGCTGAR